LGANHLSLHRPQHGYCPYFHEAHAAQASNIQVVVLELNPHTVKQLISDGVMALFGDAKEPESLKIAAIENARGIALTFPDKDLAVSSAKIAREMNPEIIMHARCKFKAELEAYEQAGIEHILLDEEQSGRAMIKSVMLSYSTETSTELNEDWI